MLELTSYLLTKLENVETRVRRQIQEDDESSNP
jgi:hypothetical protein